MKKAVILLVGLLVFSLVSSSIAEDMPILIWYTATPRPTATPTPTPTPTPEPVIQTGEITDSWEEIIAAIDDGSARQRYAVGATKELDLGSLGTVHMQLAGFDLDECADGQGKAATTWIALELLPERRAMNENWTNIGGWHDSDLRKYLQDTVLPSMPSSIRQRIVRVVKRQWADDEWQTTEDTVWIPNFEEVFNDDALYYGLFLNKKDNRVKYRQGSAAWWWLRSAGSYDYFSCVGSGGSYDYANAGYSGGVAFGFCL